MELTKLVSYDQIKEGDVVSTTFSKMPLLTPEIITAFETYREVSIWAEPIKVGEAIVSEVGNDYFCAKAKLNREDRCFLQIRYEGNEDLDRILLLRENEKNVEILMGQNYFNFFNKLSESRFKPTY